MAAQTGVPGINYNSKHSIATISLLSKKKRWVEFFNEVKGCIEFGEIINYNNLAHNIRPAYQATMTLTINNKYIYKLGKFIKFVEVFDPKRNIYIIGCIQNHDTSGVTVQLLLSGIKSKKMPPMWYPYNAVFNISNKIKYYEVYDKSNNLFKICMPSNQQYITPNSRITVQILEYKSMFNKNDKRLRQLYVNSNNLYSIGSQIQSFTVNQMVSFANYNNNSQIFYGLIKLKIDCLSYIVETTNGLQYYVLYDQLKLSQPIYPSIPAAVPVPVPPVMTSPQLQIQSNINRNSVDKVKYNELLKKAQKLESENKLLKESNDDILKENNNLLEIVAHNNDILKENEELKLRINELINENKENNCDNQDNQENKESDPCKWKFRDWLFHTVRLPQYLSIFCLKECNDVTMIEFIDQDILQNDFNISEKIHLKLILKSVNEFKEKMNKFQNLLNNNKSLKMYRDCLRNYGIITIDELRNEIKNKNDITRLLNVTDYNEINKLFNIVQTNCFIN